MRLSQGFVNSVTILGLGVTIFSMALTINGSLLKWILVIFGILYSILALVVLLIPDNWRIE